MGIEPRQIEDRLLKELTAGKIVRGSLNELSNLLEQHRTAPEMAAAYVDRYGRRDARAALAVFDSEASSIIASMQYWRICIELEIRERINKCSQRA